MNPQQPQQFPILDDNRKRSHSSSSSNSPSASPSRNFTNSSESSSSTRKKRNTAANNYSGTDSSSAESSNPSSSSFGSRSSFFYSSSSNTTPPRLTAQRSVPAFLNKLYNMVEDISTNSLVRWSKDGTSFIVEKHEEFAKTVLPRFYKHNTFASFVRQLNMYDFHKVPHIQQGVLIAENEHDLWEFSNPHFQRGRPDLLILVTRKRNRDRDTVETENLNITTLAQSLDMLKKHQSTISNDLKDLHRDNEILWQETLTAREKYQKHQEAIQKILQFLTAIFSNDNLAITMSNPDLLPKGLIEEAALLAGMPMGKLNMKQKSKSSSSSSTPLNPALASSALSNIVNSVLKLYGPQSSRIAPGIDQSQLPNHSEQAELQDKSSNGIHNNSAVSLNDFSQTLNTATKSAQSITQDIDTLQLNIESLANDLGIDPNQFDDELDLQDNYQQMLKPTNNPNFVEINNNDDDNEEDFADYNNNKRHLKNMNKQPQQQVQHRQPRLQRQTRNHNVHKMNDYRDYLPMNNQPDLLFNPALNAVYYPMGNPPMMMNNNPAFTQSNNNNDNPIVDNPYIVPYYNNNSNEENYDDNT